MAECIEACKEATFYICICGLYLLATIHDIFKSDVLLLTVNCNFNNCFMYLFSRCCAIFFYFCLILIGVGEGVARGLQPP